MFGVLLSLIPLFAWGVSDFVSSRLSKYHPAAVNLLYTIGGFVVALGLMLIFGPPRFELANFGVHLCAALILNAGFAMFLKAFSHGAVGVVSVIANAYAVFTVTFSVLFLGVHMTLLSWVAVAIVMLGLTILTYKKDEHHTDEQFKKYIIFSFLAMLLFGIGFLLFDVASNQQWHGTYILYQCANILVAPVLFLLWTRRSATLEIKKASSDKLVYIGALAASVGSIGLFAAIQVVGNASFPSVFSAAAPLVTSILAFYFNKEHLQLRHRIGAVIIVVGIMLLSL